MTDKPNTDAVEDTMEALEVEVEETPTESQESVHEMSDSGETADSESTALAQALEESRQQLLRVQADFDNFRRRTRLEKEELQQFANKKLLTELLPVLDNMERALQSFRAAGAPADLLSGVEMMHRQFTGVLSTYGVQAMEAEGQTFNPNFHEAVMQEPADGREAGIIVQVLQQGYVLHDKVLRPAMVKVTV